jgi:hypothetical protein
MWTNFEIKIVQILEKKKENKQERPNTNLTQAERTMGR